jgi:hypothetical protein
LRRRTSGELSTEETESTEGEDTCNLRRTSGELSSDETESTEGEGTCKPRRRFVVLVATLP